MSSEPLRAVPASRAPMRLLRSGRTSTRRQVRESIRGEPAGVRLLDGARELPFVTSEELPAVVRALKQAGCVVVVTSGDAQGELRYFAQDAFLLPQHAARAAGRAHAVTGQQEALRPAPVRAGEPLVYESEGTERLSLGSMAVGGESWWSGSVAVPETAGGRLDETLFLRLERYGPAPTGYRGEAEVECSLPVREIDVVVSLMTNVVEQARHAGILPTAAS